MAKKSSFLMKYKKAMEPYIPGVFIQKVDTGALQLMVEKQREKMAGLELHEACTLGDYDTLEDYLKSGKFDVNYRDPEWQNKAPLHWACGRGFVDCIRLLLEHNAKPNLRMDMGWTPAHCAAEAAKLNVLRALHAASVPINKKDSYGATPLRLAETYGHWDCVKFLKQAEAEIAEARLQSGATEEDTDLESTDTDDEAGTL